MTLRILALAAASILAGCGVEGPPVPPSQAEEEARAQPGILLSGSVEAGIVRRR
jgi:hypothetical protein